MLPHAALAAGRLFRSGSPSQACQADVLLLRRDLGVRQLLDFRSADEHKEDRAWSLMLSNGVMKTYDARGNVVEVSVCRGGGGAPHERSPALARMRPPAPLRTPHPPCAQC